MMEANNVLASAEAVAHATASGARFIAIDGLPVSGKSTLADAMIASIGADIIYLDDFVKPEVAWRGNAVPAFPFPYIRYEEFLDAVQTLHNKGECAYYPYDWATRRPSPNARNLTLQRPVIIEGVSSLNPELSSLYDLKLWVASDASSVLEASLARGVGDWAREWRELFLPSVALYLAGNPQGRADIIVKGRGYPETA